MIDLLSIGQPKKPYPEFVNSQFETLATYLSLAHRIIAKTSKGYCRSILEEMLKNDDAVSYVANQIAYADLLWDENYRSVTNTVKTQYSYRNQRAIWAIRDYVRRYKTKKPTPISLSLDVLDSGSMLCDMVADTSAIDPAKQAETNDLLRKLNELTDRAVKRKIMKTRDVDFIHLHYLEGYTMQDIAELHGVTRQAVHKTISKNILKLQKMAKQ